MRAEFPQRATETKPADIRREKEKKNPGKQRHTLKNVKTLTKHRPNPQIETSDKK